MCGLVPMVGYARGDSVLYRRINRKIYGRPSQGILGNYNEGDKTILLDDLISTSGAKVEERDLVEDISSPRDKDGRIKGTGLIVKHALILLDRETGGIEAAANAGLEVHAGLTISQALLIIHHEGLIDDRSYNIAKAYVRGDLTRKEDIHLFV